jgi:hypothetical protein
MSKERELLERVLKSGVFAECLYITEEIQELLAQPEKNLLIEKHNTFLRSLVENNGEGLKELKAFDLETYNKLKEVFGLSDLPAQPEQDPVIWCTEDYESTLTNMGRFQHMVEHGSPPTYYPIPLYTGPQKREPLSGREISHGFRTNPDATHAESYWAGVEYAEKHHKIGVDDE